MTKLLAFPILASVAFTAASAGTIVGTTSLGTLGYVYSSQLLPAASSADPAMMPTWRFDFNVARPGTLRTVLYYQWGAQGEPTEVCSPEFPDWCYTDYINWYTYGVELKTFALSGQGQDGATLSLPQDFYIDAYWTEWGAGYWDKFVVVEKNFAIDTAGTYLADVGGYSQQHPGAFGYEFEFVPAPVPEPQSWALLVAGLGLTGLQVRRRRAAVANG